jgi:alpha-1,3-rhamnosyltransferase
MRINSKYQEVDKLELISVVVLTYNSYETVIETLESIKRQTYEKLELIVCDDHSTDNTIKLVRRWLKQNKRRFIKVKLIIARKNHGTAKNCNIGISQVHGKYVQMISGDDVLIEKAIEKKYRFAEEKSLNIVYSKVKAFGSDVLKVREYNKYIEASYRIVKRGWKEQYDKIILYNFIPSPGGCFYLTEYIKEKGYDIRYPMMEDYPFIYNYIVGGNEVMLLDEVLIRYRISNTSLSASGNSKYIKSCMKFFLCVKLKELIKNKKYKEAKEEFIGYLLMWFDRNKL